jgi:hypothetical protein
LARIRREGLGDISSGPRLGKAVIEMRVNEGMRESDETVKDNARTSLEGS